MRIRVTRTSGEEPVLPIPVLKRGRDWGVRSAEVEISDLEMLLAFAEAIDSEVILSAAAGEMPHLEIYDAPRE